MWLGKFAELMSILRLKFAVCGICLFILHLCMLLVIISLMCNLLIGINKNIQKLSLVTMYKLPVKQNSLA